MAGLPQLVKELRRRRVFRVAGIYIVAVWVAVQAFSEVFPALDVPAEAIRFVWVGAILGFPLALMFGWFYDLTPAGIVRTPPADHGDDQNLVLRPLDYTILAALFVIAIGIAYQQSVQIRQTNTVTVQQAIIESDPMSIAVLPLENLSGDPEQAYFVNGMHDALITELSHISGLRVTSRTSTLGFMNTKLRMPQVGRELGVRKIIEGSVYRVGNRVRIVVQLIEAAADEHLWSETYERDITDVLRLQSDITREIAEQVQVVLTKDESHTLTRAGAVNPESYEAYLRGMFHVELFTPEDMALAVRHFETAVELDPQNALAYWGLNRVCRFQLQAGQLRPREAEPKCRAPLLHALELDNSRAEVHLGLALGFWAYDYDWVAAEKSFDRAFELNPNYAEAHMFYSHFLSILGRGEEGTEQMLIARELDPLNTFIQALHGVQMTMVGLDEQGLAEINAALETTPGLGFGYDVLWYVNARLGKLDESLDAARKHFGITVGVQSAVDALDRGYAAGGYKQAMLAAAAALEEHSRTTYIPAMEISMLYELGGDIDTAMDWLDIAYDQHDPSLPYIGALPLFEGSSSRFDDMLRRMNLSQWIAE
jgi:TolB-like protein/tetratricopeptide (TPR) repeat protein